MFRSIVAAVKERDLAKGIAQFNMAVSEGIALPPSQCQTLLFLFTGFDDWIEHLRVPIPEDPAPCKAKALPALELNYAHKVLHYMESQNLRVDEAYYTAHSRVLALRGKPQEAFEVAKQCAAETPHTTKLRSFVPALMAFNKAGDASGALAVHAEMQRQSNLNDMSEDEYQPLVQVLCSHGTYDQLAPVLYEMGTILGRLSPSTVQILRHYFSKAVVGEDAPAQQWECCDVDIDPQGTGQVAWGRGQLREISLEAADWDDFRAGLRDMALAKERQAGAFQRFVEVVEESPADIYIDGANVGYYGTNWVNPEQNVRGVFSWLQVKAMFHAVKEAYPDKRVLVVMHVWRCKSSECLDSPEAVEFVQHLRATRQLWMTPGGSNDDWYWLYGTVASGKRGILISNDQMRDHIFELLRPRFFLKWRHHHQYKYHIQGNHDGKMVVNVIEPPKFTTCVQQLPESLAWMFPLPGNTWLCARPAVTGREA